MNERLNIITDDHPENEKRASFTKRRSDTERTETQARFERLWLIDPEQFNPDRSLLESVRIERTKAFLDDLPAVKTCVDLGSGYGVLGLFMAEKGCEVTAVDIAKNALNRLVGLKGITTSQDYIPNTNLQDNSFDLVLSTDLIAFLNKHEYRLYVSELVRLCKQDGIIVCSTPIDIHSDDALHLFVSLMETEIIIDDWCFSYHRLYIRLLEILKKLRLTPLMKILRDSKAFLNCCEKISKAIWQNEGISHAIFRGRKKPLMPLPQKNEQPIERKEKRFIWE